MITRREAVRLLGSASAGAFFATMPRGPIKWLATTSTEAQRQSPSCTAPMSPERITLIEAFKKQSEGLEKKFEARTHKSDLVMPYRLFRPEATGKVPLVVYLHGSGGLGNDNLKQLGLGNILGTRVWLLPQYQRAFPCYVVVPQTDRGWIRYDLSEPTEGPAKVLPGLGDGTRLALEIVDALCHQFTIDTSRIYVTGQSMGGAGVWHMIANRPQFFAAAVPCCGSISTDDGTGSIDTPLWNFHGDSDKTVSVSTSRDRIAARRRAGGHPLSTEYAGVGHNVWEWAYTEPELIKWVFAQRYG